MKRVLMVDDDPLIVRIYKHELCRNGFTVDTAEDGITAMKSMHQAKPDVLVLDLMMPRFSGQEVIKAMKANADLKTVPIIVLSNVFMEALGEDPALAYASRKLVKVRCSPAVLAETVKSIIENPSPLPEPSPAPPKPAPEKARAAAAAAAARARLEQKDQELPLSPAEIQAHETELRRKAREEFLANAPATLDSIRTLFQQFYHATAETRVFRLQDFYRKIHFLAANAGLAQCIYLAHLASVFEALLFQMIDRPERITASSLRTSAAAVDLMQMLFKRADKNPKDTRFPKGSVLVVDDDPICTRLVMWAMKQANLAARSTGDTQQAYEWLKETQFDLVLLDIGLPGMNGIEFCKVIRRLPGYAQTPVIHVTGHADFATQAESALSGSDDFIAKPVLPMELALKAVMHLIEKHPV